MPTFSTLVELLARRARTSGDRGYVFLESGEEPAGQLEFAELELRARSIAAGLQAEGAKRGDRALLLHPPGLEFVAALFGSLHAGLVAVPAYPPRRPRHAARIRGMVRDAAPRWVLTTGDLIQRREAMAAEVPELSSVRWIATEQIGDECAAHWTCPTLGPADLALLQYTSGSTSAPKGVMVTHRNLLDNEERIRRAFRQGPDSVIVGWLPLYHDMGLIGNVLQPLYAGARCYLMGPVDFLQRPVRWLRAVSRFRGTTSGGPDFAYGLCVEKVSEEDLDGVDLGCWQVAFNGAEPVRAATLRSFASTFAPWGFRHRAFFPCYGLAEATLMVSGRPWGDAGAILPVDAAALAANRAEPRPPRTPGSRDLASCGPVVGGHRLAIVDPELRTRCADGRVGEIWIAGDSVAAGYWGNPDSTRATFRARLAEEGDGTRFLRTGDLGFLHAGELYVTGRVKDLVILRGRNYYPQDFEATSVACDPDLRPSAAAFSVPGEGGEELVVVQEARRHARSRAETLARTILHALQEEHEVAVREVVVVLPGGVPTTSSGKVRRAACRRAWQEDALPVLAREGRGGRSHGRIPSTPLEAAVAEVLGMLPPDDLPLIAGGLDSLRAVELAHRLEAVCELRIGPEELLGGITLGSLAGIAEERVGDAVDRGAGLSVAAGAAEPAADFPLSVGQRGLWFRESSDPRAGVYNVPVALRVSVGLEDVPRLRRAVERLVERHPALRTTFHAPDGQPRQRIHRSRPLDFQEVAVAPGDLDEVLTREAWRSFDLEKGPLVRVRVLWPAEGQPLLLLVVHHLVVDLRSFGVLARELATLLAPGGGALPQAPSPAYDRFVAWQAEWLDGEEGQRSTSWWTDRLTPPPPELELPLDRPRPTRPGCRTGALPMRIGEMAWSRAMTRARRQGATPFGLLLTAIQILWVRYGAGEDVALGIPVVSRPGPAWADAVGFFVQVVVVRGDLAGDPTGSQVLTRNVTELRGVLAHRHVPYPYVVDRLRAAGWTDDRPLFQVIVALQDEGAGMPPGFAELVLGEAGGDVELGHLRAQGQPLPERRSEFDLDFGFAPSAGGLVGSLAYDRDLYDAPTAERLTRHLASLLDGLVDDPDRPLSALPLLSLAESHQLRTEWSPNAGARLRDDETTVVEFFRRRVEEAPEAVLVDSESTAWSFAEVDRLSDAWLGALVARGLRPGGVVAVVTRRGPWLPVVFLAVLKAGGTYLPLDPEHPPRRLRAMIEEVGAAVLVAGDGCDPELLPMPGGPGAVPVVSLGPAPELPVAVPPPGVPRAEMTAYGIFTSGSTGRPKVVLNHHLALAGQMDFVRRLYEVGFGDVMLMVTPPGFDVSIWEMSIALALGLRLVVTPPDAHRDVPALGPLMRRRGVTIVCFVPTLLRAYLAAVQGELPPTLRHLLSGGEELPTDLRDDLLEAARRHGSCSLFNGYGPSETAIDATVHRIESGEEGGPVPIGRPVDGVSLHVVGPRCELRPLGAVGELVISGRGVGPGYLGRPARTAASFVPDPFSLVPGERWYCTGDLVRRLGDGRLVFLRRRDHQVKLRGLRVELGEIEAVLVRQPGVRHAVATITSDAAGELLAAYLVTKADAPADDDLRAALQRELPPYMVPSAFVRLEELPTLPSGKVDRKALPAPQRRAAGRATAPRNPVEAALLEVWRRVLGVPEIGIDDDFFALGGDSIQGLRLAAAAREVGFETSAPDLFRHPTVAALAQVVGRRVSAPALAEPEDGEAPLLPIQEHFFATVRHQRFRWNQTVWLELSEEVDGTSLAAALEALRRRHPALRLRFRRREGRRVQSVADPVGPMLVEVDLRALKDGLLESARDAAVADLERSLDLETGELFRGVRLRLRGSDLLVLTAHHLGVDAVSWRRLVRELAAQLAGEAVAGAAGPSFLAWAAHLPAAASSLPAAEVRFWIGRAAAPAASLGTPALGDSRLQEGTSRRCSLRLSGDAGLRRLERVAQAFEARADEVLLAALGLALSPDAPLRVDVERHGREPLGAGAAAPSPEETVGWFTALFPLVLEPAPEDPARALRRVKQAWREVPRGGVGHGLLRYLSPDPEVRRALAQAPTAEVAFNFLGRLDEVVPEGAPLRPLVARSGASRGPSCERSHRLEAEAALEGGEVVLTLVYSPEADPDTRATAWIEAWCAAMEILERRAFQSGVHGRVPSELPLAELSLEELEAVLAERPTVEDLYPLTPMQEGMLVQALRRPEAGEYVCQLALRLAGDLDAARLRRAWHQVLRRHPVLRTAFLWSTPRRALQAVVAEVSLPWHEADLRHAAVGAAEAFLAIDRETGFALDRPPLLRLALLRTGEEEHLLVFTHHHLLLDGWSLPLLLEEVLAFYAAGDTVPEVASPPPFRDYLAWLAQRDRESSEAFWRRRLEDLAGATPLGLEAPAAAAGAGSVVHPLPAELVEGLEALARRHRLTVGTLVAGAWARLLHRLSGRRDVTFGLVVADRPAELPGSQRMVGLLINTVPLRLRVEPGDDPWRWLATVQEEVAAVRQHAGVALVRLRSWSRVPAEEPLFESLLAFENYPLDAESLRSAVDLDVEVVESRERSGVPLSVAYLPSISGAPAALRISSGGGLAPGTLERVGGWLREGLEGWLAAAQAGATRLAEVGMQDAIERRRLQAWNAAGPPDESLLVVQRFAEVARRQPEAVAVRVEWGEPALLTYGELELASRRLSRRLRRAGAGSGRYVAVQVERSPAAVVAVLAVLRSGAAFLPLDPSLPSARRDLLLADAGVRIGIGGLGKTAGPAGGVRWLAPSVETVRAEDGEVCELPLPEAAVGDADPAYLLYTSGSTGRPKGVVVSHRNLANYLAWAGDVLPGPEAGPLPWTTPLVFDACLKQLLLPLVTGAVVHVLPDGAASDPARVLDWARRQGSARFNCVPSLWRGYLELLEGDPAVEAPFRVLLLGGEALDGDLLRRTRDRIPGVVVWNLYGPTETTANALAGPVARGGSPTLGQPVHGLRCDVVNADGEEVPTGVEGELAIGGTGVAGGYWGRPRETAERFRPDRRVDEPGGRLYLTGDRVRRRDDGELEFLGRLDRQLKVRGVRVEPGEAEEALRHHPTVRDAVVLPAGGVLTAYVEAPEGADEEDLRSFLAERLPAPSVPARWVVLGRLPRTPSGKVDVAALPDAAAAPEGVGGLAEEPRQALLAAVWSDLLGGVAVTPGDDFFRLGGDSVLALQVAARARRQGLGVTPRQVFEHPVLADLARVAVPVTAASAAPEAEVPGRPVLLTPIQMRFFHRPPANPNHWNQALLLRPGSGSWEVAHGRLALAVERLLRHHRALSHRFPLEAGRRRQRTGDGKGSGLVLVDLSTLPQPRRTEALAAAVAAAQRSLDLEAGPLFRSLRLLLGEGEERLFLIAHHLVVDAVSWRVLLDDLAALLESPETELPPSLPFGRWAEALAGLAERGLPGEEEAFWRRQASLEAPHLPADGRGGNRVADVETVVHRLDAEASRRLLHDLVPALRVRPDEVLLAALVRALEDDLGEARLRVDLESHGRHGERLGLDLSRTVGWFTALHPLVLDLRFSPGPEEDLRIVRERLRAVPGGGLGWGLLRYPPGGGEPRLTDPPKAPVRFNYLGQLDGALSAAAPFRLASEDAGPHLDPRAERAHPLELEAQVLDGCLEVELRFAKGLHRRTTALRWRDALAAALEDLLALVERPAAVHAVTDFPDMDFASDELEDLMAELEGAQESP